VCSASQYFTDVGAEFPNVGAGLACASEEHRSALDFMNVEFVDEASSCLSLNGGAQRRFLVDFPDEFVQNFSYSFFLTVAMKLEHTDVLFSGIQKGLYDLRRIFERYGQDAGYFWIFPTSLSLGFLRGRHAIISSFASPMRQPRGLMVLLVCPCLLYRT